MYSILYRNKGEEVTMPPKLTAEQKRWEAESDARTLAEAEVIKQAPGRVRAASTAAKRMADDNQKQADALTKIAGRKVTRTVRARK